jgi:hypothetical protein
VERYPRFIQNNPSGFTCIVEQVREAGYSRIS